MNISPINFKGVKIGHNMSVSIPKKRGEEKATGFFQVVNFLDKDEYHNYRIKKPYNTAANVCVYDKETDEQISSVTIPLKRFATNPKKVIGQIGAAAYSGKDIGNRIWTDLFENSDKDDSPYVTESAEHCSDYEDSTTNLGFDEE